MSTVMGLRVTNFDQQRGEPMKWIELTNNETPTRLPVCAGGHRERPIRRRVKTIVAVALGTFALASGTSLLKAADSQALDVGGVTVGASGSYSTCTHLASITAWNLSSLQANGVWAYSWAYDYSRGGWVRGDWTPADGITTRLITAYKPYGYAYVLYARYVNGWHYAAEWVYMQNDLDNGFCN